ncbi:hypothetical protein BTA51_14600 [Hahella sp. CCB-MM4]|uniref:hypothetical protein n=1 Tax=Hahella sp. (strain CCB-MM4) TaxID=1926491 RepID=UPI000B9A3576|nr:hypothetical protein [Hahella sp. CCB-MM4]OZG72749.1 hypothetical protein BTA51_14600 [Hahella sp. CCB-MM4]
MAKKKYTITISDMPFAKSWIDHKIKDLDWLSYVDDQLVFARRECALEEYEPASELSGELNTWCERWFSAADWAAMKNSIKQARLRSRRKSGKVSGVKRVDLTLMAHKMVSTLAIQSGMTISEYLEMALETEYNKSKTTP